MFSSKSCWQGTHEISSSSLFVVPVQVNQRNVGRWRGEPKRPLVAAPRTEHGGTQRPPPPHRGCLGKNAPPPAGVRRPRQRERLRGPATLVCHPAQPAQQSLI